MDEKRLPPMPPSDAESLARNRFDNFYYRSAREFWGDNEINYIKDEPMTKCEHFFKQSGSNFICQKCNFGLMNGNDLTIQDGKLYFKNEPIPFG